MYLQFCLHFLAGFCLYCHSIFSSHLISCAPFSYVFFFFKEFTIYFVMSYGGLSVKACHWWRFWASISHEFLYKVSAYPCRVSVTSSVGSQAPYSFRFKEVRNTVHLLPIHSTKTQFLDVSVNTWWYWTDLKISVFSSDG